MDNEKQIPALRFRGFDGPWEKKKLGELGSLKNGMNFVKDAMDHGSPFVNIQDIFGKNIVDVDHLGKAEATPKQQKDYDLKKGDVLFVRSSVKLEGVGECALIPRDLPQTTYSGFMIRFRDEVGMNDNFKRYVFAAKNVRAQILAQATNSANKNISQPILASLKFSVPSVTEQKAVGDFCSDMEDSIATLEQKITKAEQFRRAMLSKLFPAEGASEPALRFRGFSGAWKKCKLASFGKATGGVSLEAEFIENGTYKVINIGSYSGESKYIDQGLRTNKTKRTAARILNKNDLVMILNDKTSEGNIIGRVLLIDADDTYVYNQRNERIEVNQSQFVPQFLYELLNADVVRNKIIRAAQGATQIYVNWSVISQLTYMIPPSINEQKQIGDFFYQLDSYISLQREKREKLRRLKAALLEKLFV